MNLIDEDELENKSHGNIKIKRIIVALIIILVILGILVGAVIYYRVENPVNVTTYVNGKMVNSFSKMVDFETDENGNTQIYFPIRDVATYFGYTSYNGEYNQTSEDNDKCYAVKEKYEVAMFELGSKRIYKLDLEDNSDEYDYYDADVAVFRSNDKLYTSEDGIENGYNLEVTYDVNKKVLQIYTMDYLVSRFQTSLENKKIEDYGIVEIDDDDYSNYKTIFDKSGSMLVVTDENKKYGVIDAKSYTFILEPKYDSIEYLQASSDFLVESDSKYGIISREKKTKISVSYDELTLMDRNTKLYRIKQGGYYGVIDENENTIINPEYTKIGIDVSNYSKNGVKNGYVLMDKIIPTQQNQLWGFYDIKGNLITDGFIYEDIGCKKSNNNNVYGLLELPEYNAIVVKNQYNKYTIMDESGNDDILPAVFDDLYIQVSNGEETYKGTKDSTAYDITKLLEKKGVSSENN